MTVLTEGRHAASFIISEANGHRSRASGTLKTGENLVAGAVLMDDGAGKLVEFEDSTGAVAAGILMEATNATSADIKVAYIARDAEVNGNLLNYFDTDTSGAIAALAAIGVIVR